LKEDLTMVDIALDPNMYYRTMSTAQTLRKARELGFDFVELSPNEEFHFWHRYPKADAAFVDGLVRAVKETGVEVRTLNPVFNWSSADEAERQAQVRNWRRLLELADRIGCREITSEFSGDPNTPRRCEQQWYKSVEELAPLFERYGIRLNMEAHPYDWVERHDEAYAVVRGVDLPWVGYEYCCPHTFHLSDGAGDAGRMILASAPLLREVHVADSFNHKANDGNRYILNPPGVDARVHQHNQIGEGEVPWDEVFGALRQIGFDGVVSVCVFGWHEKADQANTAALHRLRQEFA
jgi:myo-inositol catabolism protein IolH